MIRPRAARVVGLLVLAVMLAVVAGATAAGSAPAPNPNPAPTPAHPLQGLRLLTVATVPAVPGMQFAVDGVVFTANAEGIASILVTKDQREAVRNARDAHLSVLTPVLEYQPGVRAKFAGWSGVGEYRSAAVPEEFQRATFNVEYLTSFTFVAPGGARVDPGAVQSMRLRSTTGGVVMLGPIAPAWLQGSRATTGRNGLQVGSISYAIDLVRMRGSNVVHGAQQRFFPSLRQSVTVPVLVFDVRFGARDALFGGAAGSAVVLEYPDGHNQKLRLGADGLVAVPKLPRGNYHLKVLGAGPSYSQELRVSRAARFDLDVLSWLDVVLLAAVALAVLGTLLAVGLSLRRRRHGAAVELAEAVRDEAREEELVGSP